MVKFIKVEKFTGDNYVAKPVYEYYNIESIHSFYESAYNSKLTVVTFDPTTTYYTLIKEDINSFTQRLLKIIDQGVV